MARRGYKKQQIHKADIFPIGQIVSPRYVNQLAAYLQINTMHPKSIVSYKLYNKSESANCFDLCSTALSAPQLIWGQPALKNAACVLWCAHAVCIAHKVN